MYYVSEQTVVDLVEQYAVTDAIAETFAALAAERAECWPIVREPLSHADAIFGFKSGFDRSLPALGVKAGGLWPGNAALGVPNHQSTVILFDPDSGAPHALIRATHLTALRTAAISALSIRHLARGDASILGVVGAGGQAEHQLRAALRERKFTRVIISDPQEANAAALVESASKMGVVSELADLRTLTEKSDVIITITPSREPIIQSDWVQPGTHISAMGADTRGKQELETALISRARVFADIANQAISLGEMQHAFASGLIAKNNIVPLGDVMVGKHPGRGSEEDITIFDSTGIALQDLASSVVALDAAKAAGRAIELE